MVSYGYRGWWGQLLSVFHCGENSHQFSTLYFKEAERTVYSALRYTAEHCMRNCVKTSVPMCEHLIQLITDIINPFVSWVRCPEGKKTSNCSGQWVCTTQAKKPQVQDTVILAGLNYRVGEPTNHWHSETTLYKLKIKRNTCTHAQTHWCNLGQINLKKKIHFLF